MTTVLLIVCIAALFGCVAFLSLEVRDLNAAIEDLRTNNKTRFEYLRHDGCHGWTTRDLLKDFRALCDYLEVKPYTRRDISPVEIVKEPKGKDGKLD